MKSERKSPTILFALVFMALIISYSTVVTAQTAIPEDMKKDLSNDLGEIQNLIEIYNNQNNTISENSSSVMQTKNDKNTKNIEPSTFPADWDPFKKLKYLPTSAPVYSAPNASESIGTAPPGTVFFPTEEQSGYYRIKNESGKPAWVSTKAAENVTWGSDAKQWEAFNVFPSTTDVVDTIIEKAASLRDKYKNNTYLEADGFAITLGLPPSASFSFKFK